MDSKANGEYKVSKLTFDDADGSSIGKVPNINQKVYDQHCIYTQAYESSGRITFSQAS